MFLFLLLLISIPFWGFAEDCLKLTMVTHSWLQSDSEDEEQPMRLLNHLISEVKVKNQSSHLQLCILVTFNNIFLFVHFWIKVFCHFTKPLLLSRLFSLSECCDEWCLWQEVLFIIIGVQVTLGWRTMSGKLHWQREKMQNTKYIFSKYKQKITEKWER